MLNGKPLQTSAEVILNQLPANAIQNIEVITAPSAKYDPEGTAGIINITTNQNATDGLFSQFNVRVGLPSIEDYNNAAYHQRYGGDATVNYRKGPWNLSFGLSYLRNDQGGRRVGNAFTILQDTTTLFPSNGERSLDNENYSGRFTVSYTPNPKNTFSLGFYAGVRNKVRTADILYFNNRGVVNGEEAYNFQYFNENERTRNGDFVLGSIDYAHTFANSSRLSTSFLYEYTLLGGPTFNFNRAFPNTEQVLQEEFNTNDNPLNGLRYQLNYAFAEQEWGKVETGYQFRYLDHTGNFVYQRRNLNTGEFELIPAFSSEVDLTRLIHSGFAQFSGEKGRWTYGAGVRLEYMDRKLDLQDKLGAVDTTYVYDFIQPYPSANLQYAFTDLFRLKAAYSRRVERTTTFKMNPFPEREHSEVLEQGDPELRPEFIDLVELGLVKDFKDNSVYATAYFRNVDNLVNRVNNVFNDSIINRIYSNVGSGQAIGLEAGLELMPSEKLKLFAGGNLYQYTINGTFDNRPVNSASLIYSFNANATYNFSNSLSVQGSFNYISDQNTALGEDSRFYSPNLTVRKTFLDGRLTTTLQWLNIDMGLLKTAEKSITTSREGEFFTTTRYANEVDIIMLNVSYTLNDLINKSKFIKSEFGEKEF